tara:strand:+ start:202 stop:414 length:213 start_codon:yes stop_codon:yes gene_type:complete
MNDLNLFKKKGFLVKENLISQTKINKINKIVNEVISKEKKGEMVMVQMELNPMIITILYTIQVLQKIKKY